MRKMLVSMIENVDLGLLYQRQSWDQQPHKMFLRHFMACPRVLISDTLSETPENNNLLKLKSIPV